MSKLLNITKYHTRDRDYTLHFSPISNSDGNIRFIDHSIGRESEIGLAVDDSEFRYRIQQEFPSIIADLIDLAVAIHATDRLTLQNQRQEQTRICVVLPVRYPELLSSTSFQDKLSDLLAWATGSQWLFDFRKRFEPRRNVEKLTLFPSTATYVDEVTLWSGGLDALAGLYTRLKKNHKVSFILFGTGSNEQVYARVRVLLILHLEKAGACCLCDRRQNSLCSASWKTTNRGYKLAS